MSEGERRNFDLLMTLGAKGKLESSIGFNCDEFQEDLRGLFEQEKTNGLSVELNKDAQVDCVIASLRDGGDEIDIHHAIVDALIQSYPKMKLPSRNKRAREFISSAKWVIEDRKK